MFLLPAPFSPSPNASTPLLTCPHPMSHHPRRTPLATPPTTAPSRSFLIRLPETRSRMTNMLDVMLRLKNVRNLDPRRQLQVDNAFFECKPTGGAGTILHLLRYNSMLYTMYHILYYKPYSVQYNVLYFMYSAGSAGGGGARALAACGCCACCTHNIFTTQ